MSFFLFICSNYPRKSIHLDPIQRSNNFLITDTKPLVTESLEIERYREKNKYFQKSKSHPSQQHLFIPFPRYSSPPLYYAYREGPFRACKWTPSFPSPCISPSSSVVSTPSYERMRIRYSRIYGGTDILSRVEGVTWGLGEGETRYCCVKCYDNR